MNRKLFMLFLAATLGVLSAMSQNLTDAAGVEYRAIGEDGAEVVLGDKFYRGDIVIPETVDSRLVRSIGFAGMNACHGLRSVALPEGITDIGDYAFNACDSVRTVNFPTTLERIGNHAFNGCYLLTQDVVVPDACATIGDMAFTNCRRITGMTIGSGVTEIGTRAFQGCSQLKNFVVSPDNVAYTEVDGVLFTIGVTRLLAFPRKNDLRDSYKVPATVTEISEYAFYANDLLKEVVLPEGIEAIGEWAFANNTKIKTVTLGDRIQAIGANAFYGCTQLKEVHCISITPLDVNPYRDPFGYFSDKSAMTLYVPSGSLEAYRQAPVWRDFGNIVEQAAGLTDIKASTITVHTEGLTLVIKGAEQGAFVRVSNLIGQVVTQGTQSVITLPAAGIYLVEVDGNTFKVVVGL